MKDEILYVLVLYGCPLEQSKTFQTLIAPCGEKTIGNLYVYDNSPTLQETQHKVAAYIHDTNNGGLGKAYNEACKFATAHSYKWLLLLDQDTIFPEKALVSYKKAASESTEEMIVPRIKVVGGKYLSPIRHVMKYARLQNTAPTGVATFKCCEPVNSGIMVSVKSFTKAGGYEEAVWLDLSDICFIQKYSKHYRSFFIMPEVTCLQTFSGLEDNLDKIYKRYRIFLECARNYPKPTLSDTLDLLILSLRQTLSRTLKEHTTRYLKTYWEIYVRGKN